MICFVLHVCKVKIKPSQLESEYPRVVWFLITIAYYLAYRHNHHIPTDTITQSEAFDCIKFVQITICYIQVGARDARPT